MIEEQYNILSAVTYTTICQFLEGNLLHNDPEDRNLLKVYLQSENYSIFCKYFYQLAIYQELKEVSSQELSEVKLESQSVPAHTHTDPPHSIPPPPDHHLDSNYLAPIPHYNFDTIPIHFDLAHLLPLCTDYCNHSNL
jgi:hypothetical protein